MTRYLLATDSVDVTAAACDYLDGRANPDDQVIAVTVLGDDVGGRDAADALNVATVRLGHEIERIERDGDPATAILDLAHERDVDILIAGLPDGEGDVLAGVLAGATIPVVVVPPE